jgi:hypothetical protein
MLDAPESFGRSRTGRRLAALMADRTDEDEQLVAWTRAWVSRDRRWNWLLAARHRDFLVLSDRRLMLWSCGFFTRRPRHAVFDQLRRGLAVDHIGPGPGRHLRLHPARGRPLRFDLSGSPASSELAERLADPVEIDAGTETAEDGPCPS